MYAIDLNSDLGESFGAYKIGSDADVIPLISSANVACGFHAGDPTVMAKTAALCASSGCALGAHPGYPDLVGFGRRNMAVSPADVKAMTTYQIGALDAFCKAQGIKMQHVKPHGAMYNMAAKDAALADAICKACKVSASQLHEEFSDFRLEDHDQRDESDVKHGLHDVGHQPHVECGDDDPDHIQRYDGEEDAHRGCAPDPSEDDEDQKSQ